jgi:MFS family permease
VAVCGVLVSLTQSLLVPVLSTIQHQLGSSSSATEWLLTSTLLVGAVAVPVFGRLGDLYGKRLMLMVSAGALLASVPRLGSHWRHSSANMPTTTCCSGSVPSVGRSPSAASA